MRRAEWRMITGAPAAAELGNAAHVHPHVPSLPDQLGPLEQFPHKDDDPLQIKGIGLARAQFECIYPDLDRNGRIGRHLIAPFLEHWGLLKEPLLYVGLYFERHREKYFLRLTALRVEGDWEGWTDSFLDGIATVADGGVASAREFFLLVTTDRGRALAHDTTSVSAARLFKRSPNHPIITVAAATELIDTSKPRATRMIETLVAAGILIGITGKKRDSSFA